MSSPTQPPLQSNPSTTPLSPSLFALPNELLLQILSHTAYPTLYTLRRTHSRFDFLITTRMLHTQLLDAEHASPSPFAAHNHYVCFACVRVLPASRFSDKSRKTPKGHGGVQASKRFCIRCGLRDNRYQPGQAVVLHGVPGVICHLCKKVYRDDRQQGGATGEKDDDGFCTGHARDGTKKGQQGGAEASKVALESLRAGRRLKMARRRARSMFGAGDDYDYNYDNGGGHSDDEEGFSDTEFTPEYLWEAWGYDPEC